MTTPLNSACFGIYKNINQLAQGVNLLFDNINENTDLNELSIIKLQFFLDKVCTTHKQSTNQTIFNFIKNIIFFAIRFDFIPENQIKLKSLDLIPKRKTIEDLKEDKEKKDIIYTLSDLDNFFSQIKRVNFLEKFIFYFALRTGMRAGEILGLTWKDINLKNNTIEITKNYLKNVKILDTPKTSSSIRTIYLPDELKQNLKKIKNEQNKNKFKYGEKYKKEYRNNKEIDYIFKKEDGSKITYNTLLNTIKKIQKIDKNFHFHRLRHSFCSQYLKNGVDVLHVSKILGHASVNTTLKIYSHIKKEDILEIMKSTKIL